MTTVLHHPADPYSPIACDMSTACDTPEQRLAGYRALFGRALTGRERRADSVVLTFSAGAQSVVEDLVRREAACCPFVDYRVDVRGDTVVWTTTDCRGEDAIAAVLDALYELPEGGETRSFPLGAAADARQ
jgi:hypothetical protein